MSNTGNKFLIITGLVLCTVLTVLRERIIRGRSQTDDGGWRSRRERITE
jgi:hypothetical protein